MSEETPVRLEGVSTTWVSYKRYGVATATLHNEPIDVFIHADTFKTHHERKTVRREGLEQGQRVIFDAKPPTKKHNTNYEASD